MVDAIWVRDGGPVSAIRSDAARSRCLCLRSKYAAARMRMRQIEGSEEKHDMPPSVATEVPMTEARNSTTCLLCEVNQRPPPSEGGDASARLPYERWLLA